MTDNCIPNSNLYFTASNGKSRQIRPRTTENAPQQGPNEYGADEQQHQSKL